MIPPNAASAIQIGLRYQRTPPRSFTVISTCLSGTCSANTGDVAAEIAGTVVTAAAVRVVGAAIAKAPARTTDNRIPRMLTSWSG